MTGKKPRSMRKPELVSEDSPRTVPRKKSTRTNPGNGFQAPTDEEIARKAYTLWEDRGRPMGSPDEDWFRAKNELTMKATA